MTNNKTCFKGDFHLLEVISQVIIPDTFDSDQTIQMFSDSGKNLVRGGVYDIHIYTNYNFTTVQEGLDFMRTVVGAVPCGPVGLAIMLASNEGKIWEHYGRYYSLDVEEKLNVSQRENLPEYVKESRVVSVDLLMYPPDEEEQIKSFDFVPSSYEEELFPCSKLVCFVKK